MGRGAKQLLLPCIRPIILQDTFESEPLLPKFNINRILIYGNF